MTGTIHKNLLDIILPEEGLRFREHFGKVEFTYAEKVEEGCYHEIHEVVPTHISKLGEEKILNYVHQKIEEHKRENLAIYCFGGADPAIGKSEAADYFAFSIIAVDSEDNIYVIDYNFSSSKTATGASPPCHVNLGLTCIG